MQTAQSKDACAALDQTPSSAMLEQLADLVRKVKGRAIFLVHFYQPTWIKTLLGDCNAELVVADSQELARVGSESEKPLLFCVTVPFMAGSSAILARDQGHPKGAQQVVLADPDAGCSLEESAPNDLVKDLFDRLQQAHVKFVPACYTNVSVQLKALIGEYGGIVHTSSNAMDALRWCEAQKATPLFLPDQHLAQNVAAEAKLTNLALWDRFQFDGGVTDEQLQQAQMVLYNGECNVHVKASGKTIEEFAKEHPGAHLLLHPEVPNRHIRTALRVAGRDHVGAGSTRFIEARLKQLGQDEPGVDVGIATEGNFVTELQQQYADRLKVHNLLRNVCACVHMRTRPEQLRSALQAVAENRLEHSAHGVRLNPETKAQARAALSRSLELRNQSLGLDWE